MEGFSYRRERRKKQSTAWVCAIKNLLARPSGAVAIPLKRNATLGNFPTSTIVSFWQSAICHLQSAICHLKSS
jgi:hypothetical protein